MATGSDGYEAIFSLGELDPMFGGTGAPDLIAYEVDGGPLGPDGFARVVVPGDNFGGRYVSNLVSLEVIGAVVPEPGTLLLVVTGLIGMMFFHCKPSLRWAIGFRKSVGFGGRFSCRCNGA